MAAIGQKVKNAKNNAQVNANRDFIAWKRFKQLNITFARKDTETVVKTEEKSHTKSQKMKKCGPDDGVTL
ncbi:MAG: hypothetical protein ACI4A8_02695 [Muribaculaceae bacterium]